MTNIGAGGARRPRTGRENMTRTRSLLTVLALALSLSAGAAPGIAPLNAAQKARPGRIPIALQLYSVRDDCAKDLPGVLKAVAGMGYEGVEFAGYYGYSAEQLRKMLDENGLRCCGTHIGLESLQGDELEKTVAFNKTLGNKFLIVPGLAEVHTKSRAAWLETAKIFSDISKKLAPFGMYVGYHNHMMEFTPVDGELPWDTFFGNTDKRVLMQFDTGNALTAGVDSIPFLKKYPGRTFTVHCKEYSPDGKATIGEGQVHWKEVLKTLKTTGKAKWFIVEVESYPYTPLETARRSLEGLRALLR